MEEVNYSIGALHPPRSFRTLNIHRRTLLSCWRRGGGAFNFGVEEFLKGKRGFVLGLICFFLSVY